MRRPELISDDTSPVAHYSEGPNYMQGVCGWESMGAYLVGDSLQPICPACQRMREYDLLTEVREARRQHGNIQQTKAWSNSARLPQT